MFETLSGRLGEVFDRLRKRGSLSEADVNAALREVRVALLEADVALPVVKSFVDKVRDRAVGAEVLRSVTPGQMVVKIVHDQLVEMLGAETSELDLKLSLSNGHSVGFWKTLPDGEGRFRFVNNTLDCAGPQLVVPLTNARLP